MWRISSRLIDGWCCGCLRLLVKLVGCRGLVEGCIRGGAGKELQIMADVQTSCSLCCCCFCLFPSFPGFASWVARRWLFSSAGKVSRKGVSYTGLRIVDVWVWVYSYLMCRKLASSWSSSWWLLYSFVYAGCEFIVGILLTGNFWVRVSWGFLLNWLWLLCSRYVFWLDVHMLNS